MRGDRRAPSDLPGQALCAVSEGEGGAGIGVGCGGSGDVLRCVVVEIARHLR